MQRFWLVK